MIKYHVKYRAINIFNRFNIFMNVFTAYGKYFVIIGRIYRYQFQCNYLKKQNYFAAFLLHFWNQYFVHFQNKKREELGGRGGRFFWNYWFRRRGYWNLQNSNLIPLFFIILNQIEVEKLIFGRSEILGLLINT